MSEFSRIVRDHYLGHARQMPWRDDPSFYNVLVSEIMLQQTQVDRVVPKFLSFMRAFPTLEALASASLADVLRQWQGLGYNRRAKYLHEAAKYISNSGTIPSDLQSLVALPGVGPNTAAAIMNYAFGVPAPFVETNIRTVYFNHIFAGRVDVSDREVLAAVRSTMPAENTREWFWALMDYGAFLKSQGAGQLSTSRHYKKQSRFDGSIRQARGRILAALVDGALSKAELMRLIGGNEVAYEALRGLLKDGLVEGSAGRYHLTK